MGPTASGKTELAVRLAETVAAEPASVDSMTVYRGMDIGTAKPVTSQLGGVPYHLIDLVEPSEAFSVAQFQKEAERARAGIEKRGRRMLLVGGSGLYYRAVVDRLKFPGTDPETRAELELEAAAVGADRLYRRLVDIDPVAAARIEPGNVRRTVRALEVAAITGRPFSDFARQWEQYPTQHVHVAGIRIASDVLDVRIRTRVGSMLEHGWLNEARTLMAGGLAGWLTASHAIGYAELAAHLEGRMTLEEAVDRTVRRAKELARRQMAWFRKDPRVRWFDAGEGGALEAADQVLAFFEKA